MTIKTIAAAADGIAQMRQRCIGACCTPGVMAGTGRVCHCRIAAEARWIAAGIRRRSKGMAASSSARPEVTAPYICVTRSSSAWRLGSAADLCSTSARPAVATRRQHTSAAVRYRLEVVAVSSTTAFPFVAGHQPAVKVSGSQNTIQVSMNCRNLIIALCTRPRAVFNGHPSVLAMSTNFILL